jgi:RimJ/RimL family protein N-acetyltransferase
MLYRVAFELLELEMIYARTASDNKRALAIHAAYGLTPHRLLPQHVQLGMRVHDAIEHRMTRSAWAACAPALTRLTLVGVPTAPGERSSG